MTDQHTMPGAHVDCPVCGAKKWERCAGRRPHAERVELEHQQKLEKVIGPLVKAALCGKDGRS